MFICYNCGNLLRHCLEMKCIMHNKLQGSNLTRAMLEHDYKNIWCAVDDNSDKQATSNLNGNDFTAYIVKYQNGYFYCDGGMQWLYAVPIKIVPLTDIEVIFSKIAY